MAKLTEVLGTIITRGSNANMKIAVADKTGNKVERLLVEVRVRNFGEANETAVVLSKAGTVKYT